MGSPRILLWGSTFRWPKVTPIQNKVNGFRPLYKRAQIHQLKKKYSHFHLKGPSPQTGPVVVTPDPLDMGLLKLREGPLRPRRVL